MKLDIEEAKILTLSTAHLHPVTRDLIETRKGDIEEGPSIAVREEGFLVNTMLGDDEAPRRDTTRGLYEPLNDRFPDLCLVLALARGQGATWVNFDIDGVEYDDILPCYEDAAEARLPDHPIWERAHVVPVPVPGNRLILKADCETLERLGRMVGLAPDRLLGEEDASACPEL